jgi:hypothetical protein
LEGKIQYPFFAIIILIATILLLPGSQILEVVAAEVAGLPRRLLVVGVGMITPAQKI